MPDKNSFIFYDEWGESFALLAPKDQSRLLMAILEYRRTGEEPVLSGAVKVAFSFIKAALDRDSEKYADRCEKNRVNGAKGGRPKKANGFTKKQMVMSKTERIFEKPKKPDHDNDHDNDYIPPISPKGEYSESFIRFWEAYPRKIAKGAAYKAFKKINPGKELVGDFLSAIRRQKESADWKRDNGQYIPHPSTWLNQRRWEDEQETERDDGWEYLPVLEEDDGP